MMQARPGQAAGSGLAGARAKARSAAQVARPLRGEALRRRALEALLGAAAPVLLLAGTGASAQPMLMATDEAAAAHTIEHASSTAAHRAAAEAPARVYVDLRWGEAEGRVVIETFRDVPIGTQRFVELAQGHDGVSYRAARVDAVGEGFIQSSGLRSLSYRSGAAPTLAGGETVEQLEVELEERRHSHAEAGSVSLSVRPATPRGFRERLVAYNGKLVTVQEPLGAALNGTGFVITTGALPSLDATNLVVGRVVEGMDVVRAVAALPRVKDNTGSAFYKVAKFAGDKRADVASRTFGKPFAQVVVADSGLSR